MLSVALDNSRRIAGINLIYEHDLSMSYLLYIGQGRRKMVSALQKTMSQFSVITQQMGYFYLLKQVPLYSDFGLLRKTGKVSKILALCSSIPFHIGGTNGGRSSNTTPKCTIQFTKLKRKAKSKSPAPAWLFGFQLFPLSQTITWEIL